MSETPMDETTPRQRGRHRAADAAAAEAAPEETTAAAAAAGSDAAETSAAAGSDAAETSAAAPAASEPESELEPDPAQPTGLPPGAAERDAAKRDELADPDPAIEGDDITFVTRGVSAEERAAVVAVLTRVREEESQQVKRVARRDREPWARSQRVPEGIADLLAEG